MNELRLRHSSVEMQKTLDDLGEEDHDRIGAFLKRVADYRVLLRRNDAGAAARYHDTLVGEVAGLREHYSKLKMHMLGGAAAGALAGSVVPVLGTKFGGLAGGALGYLTAKQRKTKMLAVCDALLMELGPRPQE